MGRELQMEESTADRISALDLTTRILSVDPFYFTRTMTTINESHCLKYKIEILNVFINLLIYLENRSLSSLTHILIIGIFSLIL